MWTPPSLDELHSRIGADYRANMSGAEPGLWPNNLYATKKVFVGIADAYYRRLAWARDQRFAQRADIDGLHEMAEELGITAEPARFASGEIIVTATVGTTFDADTRFVRADGEVYITDEDVTTVTGTAALAVHSETAGSIANTEGGVVMAMETPIAGFTSAVVEDEGIRGGAEIENENSLRSKILAKKRNPPVQGAPPNYVDWAKKWPGVTRAWAYRATPSAGTVSVFFMMDEVYPDGIPSPADVTAVADILDQYAPAQANIVVQAPVAQPINVTLTALVPNSQTVRDNVVDELKAMIKRQGKPGTFAKPYTFSKTWLDEAISIAPEEDRHIMTVPAADIVFQAAAAPDPPFIATLGTVTFP